ncbi:hypothetical protein HNW77_16555 [Komagataeibacter sp. AV436]|uniref:Uncharacterized protein n=1 Tax=Komagataeibacter melomenusus TaxID=2766578 RepID=A0ABX2AHV9_9PROT|nr:hypothetical protein [Komagataeibacter melomenusus]MBV1832116.1 hypothetical protein [Komagataeibacter melomenusus]NPC67953.1 hypothetical protein [Komagataeibacter melomenusus]
MGAAFFQKAASFQSFLKKASPKTFILFSLSGFAIRGLAGKKITGLLSAGIDPVLGA